MICSSSDLQGSIISYVLAVFFQQCAVKLKEITARIPLENSMTTAAEIASVVLFLLYGNSSHTTGQLIHVDGGYVHLDRALKSLNQ